MTLYKFYYYYYYYYYYYVLYEYEGRRLSVTNLQDLKDESKTKLWKEVTIETVRKSIAQWNKNLAIANRSRVSCAHNML